MPTQAKNIAMTKPVIMWAVKVGGVILGVAHKEDDANEISQHRRVKLMEKWVKTSAIGQWLRP